MTGSFTSDWHLLFCQIKWHFLDLLQQRRLLAIIVSVYFIYGVWNGRQLTEMVKFENALHPMLGDGLFIAFAGPSENNQNLMALLIWLLGALFFLLIVGRVVASEAMRDGAVVVTRLRSRMIWGSGIGLTIFLTATLYTILIISATGLGLIAQLRFQWEASAFFSGQAIWQAVSAFSFTELVSTIFIVYASTFLLAGLFQIWIWLWTRRMMIGFVVLLSSMLLSRLLELNDNTQIWGQWLPSTQSVIGLHWPFEPTHPMFTVRFSLLYNVVWIIVAVIANLGLMRKYDFLGGKDGN